MKKYTELSLADYLKELSSEASVPGGGGTAAYVISMAMGLTQMVGRVSLKRKKKKDLSPEENKKDDARRETIQKIVDTIEKAKKDTLQVVDLDPQVYEQVMAVWSKPDEMEDALDNSFRLQADLALLSVMGKEWNNSMADLVTGSIKNDLLVSASLMEAGFRGAYHTAMINVHYMKDSERKSHAEKALSELKTRFEKGQCVDAS